MDLSFSPEELSFREQVRAFIRDNLPASIRAKAGKSPHYDRDDVLRWHKMLDARGWAASHWPAQYGGPGWSPVQRYIFMEELLEAPAPEPLSFNINMVGPVVFTFGNREQKERFLPKIRSLDYSFCQGFSEPGAGSDLAALRTSALRDGDDYVVDGQKIWTSTAHWADWMFCLVRTDPAAKKRQEGISFLLIDMKSPGMTVRPIRIVDRQRRRNDGTPDPATSILKLRGAETQQSAAELVAQAAGALGAFDPRSAEDFPAELVETFGPAIGASSTYFFSRAASIYGGASEIQKNIIAKAILGL